MTDRNVRSLVHLHESASTARVLNLLSTWRRSQGDPDYLAKPFFKNAILNRGFLIKHRLRRNEQDLFRSERHTATKILIPLEGTDLRMGGRFIFIGQKGYEEFLHEVLRVGPASENDDRRLLDLIDAMPSLDPFLLREQLKRHGHHPARCYFDVSEADVKKMFDFVQKEVEPLVRNAFGGQVDVGQTAKLVTKILSASVDSDTEPLRLTLRLEKQEYEEGVFCWKGFLYYKWTLIDSLSGIGRVSEQIGSITPHGPQDEDTRIYLDRGRKTLQRSITSALSIVSNTLQVYDEAYANLTRNGRPLAFREFLLEAPAMFTELGERLGALNHIHSFWRFRFPSDRRPKVSVEELLDILMDFESGLNVGVPAEQPRVSWA